MDFLLVFVPIFLFLFLFIPFICFFVRIRSDKLAKFCTPRSNCQRNRYQSCYQNRPPIAIRHCHVNNYIQDRQGNIFTISDETTANTAANRYPDFFYLDPTGDEAARIRAQLEKDDKDLPSYEDVIRMTSLPTTATGTTIPESVSENSTNTIAANDLGPPPSPPDMTLPPPVPPYSEIDPNAPTTSNNTASTSRGTSVAIPIENSASKTSV